ncbi:hypothetical protein [Microbulbifer sp. 2205BS26-8]|uniref:hypothetical protein n=1 Tax=Microbulbifer sp. 2205BS26-8 TaxID=3064386 RepID=UPI00273EC909|nr:hypothetical protein [Microbulbifer sp. 2205BS26-8]MDP5209996.1 hypothetical protein [Microbulbifer sp. 2205BS26-8]
MRSLFIGDIHVALEAHLGTVTQANDYRTDAGLMVSTGYAADATGSYLSGEVRGDSLLIQPDRLTREHQQGRLSLQVFGLTREPHLSRLYALEEDIYKALRDTKFHPALSKVEFGTVKFGSSGNDSGEHFGVSVPVTFSFTHSPY